MISDLRCPSCLSELLKKNDTLICLGDCKKSYPIIKDIPVLINESNSIFRLQDFIACKDTTIKLDQSKIYLLLKKIIPSISLNLKAKVNYKKFEELVLSFNPEPKILVVGGSVLGEGMELIISNPKLKFIESDVSFGPRTQIIFDAHDIPFPDNYFDGVIIQAVLEHVLDPYRCVEEIYRVLKMNGIVYAETPFMQQVHMGRYDFHRFTHLGHRRLFRKFTEIDSGAVCGPGMALAWSYTYFIYSFFSSKKLRKIFKAFAYFTSFFWKYFDYLLINKPGTLDAASGYYFLGRKSDKVFSDIELINSYRGLL